MNRSVSYSSSIRSIRLFGNTDSFDLVEGGNVGGGGSSRSSSIVLVLVLLLLLVVLVLVLLLERGY